MMQQAVTAIPLAPATPSTNSNKERHATSVKIKTVSFFAGCGGLDLGFAGDFIYKGEQYETLPIEFLRAYDNDARCIKTYTDNIGDHAELADLAELPTATIPKADLLIGGFPCQDFSTCGPKQGLSTPRGQLYKVFVKYMALHEPRIVVVENVPNLARMANGSVLETIKAELEGAGRGYTFHSWQLFAPAFGIPQTRERLFLIGVRNDIPNHPQPPAETTTFSPRSIGWAIRDLEDITDETVPNQSKYFRAAKAKNGNGQGDEVSRENDPAYTVRSNTKSRIQFHYKLERRLTMRECARIQTFPDTFIFPQPPTTAIRQIGNAVPPVLAHQVAKQIVAFFHPIIVREAELSSQAV